MKKLLTIFSLMVWMFTGTAQTGANCTDAIPFNTGNCKSEQILNTDFIWYKFTATQATQRIEFRKQNGSSGHVHMMSLLKGDCIAPLKLDSVKSTPANDSLLVLDETTLITGEIYYIVLSRSSGSCTECTGDVFYDLCLQEVPQYQICASLMDGSMYNCCDFGDECVLLTVCPGTEILLSVSNTFGAFGVSWSIPGGTPSAGVGNPITVSFASPGLYLCTYVVSGTTTTTGSGYINVIPGPVNTDFTFQNPVCVGSEVCFTNISDPPNDNNGVATWNYGNGTIQYPSPCTMLECFCTTYESPGTYTVSLSVNSGCPATVAHEIEVIEPSISISTAAVCLGSASVFTIDYECFDPADIISYSWNFGDGSPAGTTSNPSHIYSSLGVYNVTLIVTDVNGNTYNAATTAAVDPPPAITAIASNYNIPSGCSSTLSASPASGISYQWQPSGLTGTNVTVNPTSTTTYTVTGTTTNGCISTATVTVNIIVPFTITGNTSACAGMSTYSVVSDITSGVSYTWTTTTGLSGSGSSANINFGLTGGGTVTFTGTYSGGCTYSASLYVGACCQVEGSIPPFYDALSSEVLAPYGTLSGGVLTVTNQTFSINGHFTVNQNLILSGCDIRMGYLAQIKIDPGVTLKITSNGLTDKTHIYACKEMWDGIYITHSNAKLLVDNGSTIEDAISAIVSHWEGNYQITSNAVYGNVIFNKNYKTLVVTNPLSGVHPGYITSSTIQCYDGVTGGNPASNGHKLRFPHSGKRSAVGAEITNMEKITIGDPLLPIYTNTFDNLDFGVRTYNSNVNVYNNNFINITAPAIPGKKEECNTGTAICATGNPSVSVTRILNVGDVAGGYYINNFTNCFKGVAITQNHSAFVWKNIFTNIGSTAVRASLNYSRSIVINQNIINYSRSGIDCYDNLASNITIDNNDIDAGTLTHANGIIAQEIVAGSTVYLIKRNTIRNVRNGIAGSGLKSSSINRNNVYLKHTTVPGQYGRGIRLTGSSLCTISANYVMGQNTSDWWIEGISVDLSYSDNVVCNETHNVFTGMFFGGVQTPNTKIAKNLWDNDYRAFVLNYGEVGPQYTMVSGAMKPNDNRWTGSHALHTQTYFSMGSTSPFYVRNSTGQYNPAVYLFSSTLFGQQIQLIPIPGNLNSMTCPVILLPAGGPPHMPLLYQIAGDSILPPAYEASTRWLLKQSLYQYLETDTVTASADSMLSYFRDQQALDNIGKLDRVEKILSNPSAFVNGLLPTAQAENNAVTASNDAESSSKWLNEVLIENALSGSSFSLSQLTDLRVLAAKCPYNEGQAVYHARTILSQLEDVEYYNSCEGTIPESQRVSQQISEVKAKSDFQLYPNPNAGEMNLHYSLDEKEQGTFSIYDVSGKLITTYNLKAGNDQLLFISESHLNNGMYFYKVIINGELRLNDKIVIIK